MCGITGYIGRSTNPAATYEFLTHLLTELQSRGDDATGFWGTQPDNGKILYHKEGMKSSEFVKKDIWKGVADLNPDLIICHARATSVGVGTAYTNKNNHPFTSPDRRIGLVHNGRIPDTEYDILKKKYETQSMTDSEILLRIFDAASTQDTEALGKIKVDNIDQVLSGRIRGIRDIWAQAIRGQMAVAIGERIDNGDRRLWLFRNLHRPCWVFDLRKELNQIFFCSTPEIWNKALENWKDSGKYIGKKVKMFELPTEEIWVLSTSKDSPTITKGFLKKYSIDVRACGTIEFDGNQHKITKNKPPVDVYTKLDDTDAVKIESYYSQNYNNGASYMHGGHGVGHGRDIDRGGLRTETPRYLEDQTERIIGGGANHKAKKKETSTGTNGVTVEVVTFANIEKAFKELQIKLDDLLTTVHNVSLEGGLKIDNIKDVLTTIEETPITRHTNLPKITGALPNKEVLETRIKEFKQELTLLLSKISIKDKTNNIKQEEYVELQDDVENSFLHIWGSVALVECK